MKNNQNDLIISVVAIVLGLIGFSIGFFTKRQVQAPASPEVVNLAPPQLQGADVKTATALPAGGNQGSAFGGAGGSGNGGANPFGGNPTIQGPAGGGGGGGGSREPPPTIRGASSG